MNIQHLVKSSMGLEMKSKKSSNAQVLAMLLARLEAAPPNEVTSLYRNGSIWIYRSHLESKSISEDSILFLGPRNGTTSEIVSNKASL
jgi:hypothetical protein